MKLLSMLTLALLLHACSSEIMPKAESQNNVGSSAVRIRVANHSKFEMRNVVVEIAGKLQKYERILPGEFTNYIATKQAYSYTYVEALINGKKAILQPTDYVGENPLATGSYTYILSYNPKATSEYNRISIQLKEDLNN